MAILPDFKAGGPLTPPLHWTGVGVLIHDRGCLGPSPFVRRTVQFPLGRAAWPMPIQCEVTSVKQTAIREPYRRLLC